MTGKGPRDLFADIYLPETEAPADLVVWMHSGGFRVGSRRNRNHALVAAEFLRRGYATAFIDYRLSRPIVVLSEQTEVLRPALVADAEAAGEEMHRSFYGPRALAVVEDCCAFLNFASDAAAQYGLSGRMIVAGSSSGAISALNTLYLPQHLGLPRPEIATVLAFSGGFAYPSYMHATGARIFALHSPHDPKVPISSIRRLAKCTADPMVLIECPAQEHGSLMLQPEEPISDAIDRCVTFDRVADPLAFPETLA